MFVFSPLLRYKPHYHFSASFSNSAFTTQNTRSNPWPFCNSIIRASIQKGSPQNALLHFNTILHSRTFTPDHRTLTLLLEACRLSMDPRASMAAHGRISKTGFESHARVCSSLFHLYLDHGCLHEAHQLFDAMPDWGFDPFPANLMIDGYLRIGDYDIANLVFARMPVRDLISWNSMIAGCGRSSRFQEAIGFFERMLRTRLEPDGFTFSAVLSVCARIGALHRGEWIHNLMLEKEMQMNYILNAALIDMYSKCGKVERSREIFEAVARVHVSIWNTMISGLAIHGLGLEALDLFSRMEREGAIPDHVTFVGLLTACSHCGMVREGHCLFNAMQREYLIVPLVEHYGAMVDLLARAGQLQEAYETIKTMPMEPDIVVWRSLLSACRTYQQTELGEIAIAEIRGHQSGDYVLLSNIYSLAQRWHCAQKLWKVMKDNRIKKKHGLSWLEVDGRVHKFKAGDRSHPESDDIYRTLNGLTRRIRVSGFVPSTGLVVMDVLEEEKEENLNGHSEKLAVAYAVLKTCSLKEIRVSKNLRTCLDCHSWLKMVSSVLSRVIIVRDRVRFHRFEKGSCSCRDYW